DAHRRQQREPRGDQADDRDGYRQDLGEAGPGQRFTVAERPLAGLPFQVADHRYGTAGQDQRRGGDVTPPGNAGGRVRRRRERQPADYQRERGAAPRQEGPLVGEGVAGARLGAVIVRAGGGRVLAARLVSHSAPASPPVLIVPTTLPYTAGQDAPRPM